MYLEFLSHESHKFVYIYVILLSTLEVCILESILFNIYIYIYIFLYTSCSRVRNKRCC